MINIAIRILDPEISAAPAARIKSACKPIAAALSEVLQPAGCSIVFRADPVNVVTQFDGLIKTEIRIEKAGKGVTAIDLS